MAEDRRHIIPPETLASIYCAAKDLGCFAFSTWQLWNLLKAAGLPIPEKMQRAAEFWGWEREGAASAAAPREVA